MQISNMLPVLLDILTGLSRQNIMNRAAPGQETAETARQVAEKTAEAAAVTGTGSAGEGDRQVTGQSSPAHNLPDFLPLPLKSPLFAESGFFIKNDRDNPTATGEGAHTSIFICLRTESLGILWISLAAGNESLTLSFYTETGAYTKALKESFPALVEGLQKLGYPSVNAAGITRPGIRSCSDIAPGGNNPANYILDLEV
ncbi:MAG: hypothetical protein ACOY40_16135 [Bacillota bacterium]